MPIITKLLTSMTCVNDVSDLSMEGKSGVESSKGTSVTVTFNRCREAEPAPAVPRCKSNEQIDQFIKEHRMFILYNDQNYLSETYGAGNIDYNVKAAWVNFDLDNPFYRYYYLQEQAVES